MITSVASGSVRTPGEFKLERYPRRANEMLRAWDAADELILRNLEGYDDAMGEVLVVNDNWGALSTALGHRRLSTLSDSYVAHAAARENCRRNHIDLGGVRLLTSFDPLPARIDLLVMKVPKSLALLEDQLQRIAPHLHDKTRVLAAAMTKHIHMSTLDLFAKIVLLILLGFQFRQAQQNSNNDNRQNPQNSFHQPARS